MCIRDRHTAATPVEVEASPETIPNLLTLRIEKMDCPTEESLIRQKLEGMQGVESLDFNLIQRKLTVRHHLQDAESIIAAVRALDMEPVIELSLIHI